MPDGPGFNVAAHRGGPPSLPPSRAWPLAIPFLSVTAPGRRTCHANADPRMGRGLSGLLHLWLLMMRRGRRTCAGFVACVWHLLHTALTTDAGHVWPPKPPVEHTNHGAQLMIAFSTNSVGKYVNKLAELLLSGLTGFFKQSAYKVSNFRGL